MRAIDRASIRPSRLRAAVVLLAAACAVLAASAPGLAATSRSPSGLAGVAPAAPPSPGPQEGASYALVFSHTAGTLPAATARFQPVGCFVQALTYWPSITVAANGDLSAQCSKTVDTLTFTGTMSGQWTSTGVTIHVEDSTSVRYGTSGFGAYAIRGNLLVTLTMDGTATWVSDSAAHGTATAHLTCTVVAPKIPGASGCSDGKNPASTSGMDVSGTMTFDFKIFSTATAATPSGDGTAPAGSSAIGPAGSAATGAASTDGSSRGGGGINLAVLAALVAAGLLSAGLLVALRARQNRPPKLAQYVPAPEPPSEPIVLASVTADRFGGFEDSLSYGDGAGKAAPGVSAAYGSIVVSQAPASTRKPRPAEPHGATIDALREAGADRDPANARRPLQKPPEMRQR